MTSRTKKLRYLASSKPIILASSQTFFLQRPASVCGKICQLLKIAEVSRPLLLKLGVALKLL